MENMITLCGDDCSKCPRFLAQTDEELKAVAELWFRVGWRNTIVSFYEIRMVIHYILSCALLMKCKNIFYLRRNTYVYSRDS
jgi:hypothetical protein